MACPLGNKRVADGTNYRADIKVAYHQKPGEDIDTEQEEGKILQGSANHD